MIALAPQSTSSRRSGSKGGQRGGRWPLGLLALACSFFFSLIAWGFSPPPLNGYIADTAGKLTPDDITYVNNRLMQIKQATGNSIAVLIVGSLNGEPIEDVAFTTFQTWKPGQKGLDNGVLLVIAPSERRVRIETGKGVGGDLTDLQTNDIIRTKISPRLRQDQFREAIVDGTDAIAATLTPDKWSSNTQTRPPGQSDRDPSTTGHPQIGGARSCVLPLVILLIFLFIISRRGGGGGGGFMSGLFAGSLLDMLFRGGGGRGGGGESGGGGSSDSY